MSWIKQTPFPSLSITTTKLLLSGGIINNHIQVIDSHYVQSKTINVSLRPVLFKRNIRRTFLHKGTLYRDDFRFPMAQNNFAYVQARNRADVLKTPARQTLKFALPETRRETRRDSYHAQGLMPCLTN